MKETLSLYELLVKTSYHTQITESKDKKCENPLSFGSGFIVDFDNERFFVTADHTVHLDDYNNGRGERKWEDYVVSIFNNFNPPGNFLSSVVTPLGGFYYMEQFHLNKPDETPTPVDISVCKMRPLHFQYPFLTDEVRFTGETISAGENMMTIKKECFKDPQTDKNYFIFGKIKTCINDGIRLTRVSTLKECLRFQLKAGDYFLFNTPAIIEDEKEWEGLSGSPVISEDGACVGVLCSIKRDTKSIWVMPIAWVRMLIEVAIQQEKLEG